MGYTEILILKIQICQKLVSCGWNRLQLGQFHPPFLIPFNTLCVWWEGALDILLFQCRLQYAEVFKNVFE